jgi:hypothetical protein
MPSPFVPLRWPVGIVLTGWAYMWRTTPMHRDEIEGALPDDLPPELPAGVDLDGVQRPPDGAGPLFHRTYSVSIRDSRMSAEQLIDRVSSDPNEVAPGEFTRFQKEHGDEHVMRVGDEFVVRMPGPWNGPIRVIEKTPTSFRFATLGGHLEAGQIEWRARDGAETVQFQIESWSRPGDRLSNLLHHRLRMAKEVQLHMWTSVLERVVKLTGGRRAAAIDIHTRTADFSAAESAR